MSKFLWSLMLALQLLSLTTLVLAKEVSPVHENSSAVFLTEGKELENLKEILDDPNGLQRLKALQEQGAFRNYLPSLDKAMAGKKWNSFQKNYQASLKGLQKRSSPTNLDKVIALLGQADKSEAATQIKQLFTIDPKATLSRFDAVLRVPFSEMKIGYFTGEFAPFHNGHLGVARSSLNQAGLDYVFLIPTPHATNDPKTKAFSSIEWGERIEFSTLGSASEPRIAVLPGLSSMVSSDLTSAPKLGGVLEEAFRILPKVKPWTHIMGADSLERVLYRNLIETDPRPRIVVSRPGIQDKPLPKGSNVKRVKPETQKPRSATYILQQIAAGEVPEDLSPGVYEKVKKTPRYEKIIQDYQNELSALSKIKRPEITKNSVYIIDPFTNENGLYTGDPRRPEDLDFVFRQLQEKPHPTVVHLPPDTDAAFVKTYESYIRKKNYNIRVAREIQDIPLKNRIRVLHSGIINETFKSGYLRQKLSSGQSIVIFDTSDTPLSPIVRKANLEILQETQKPLLPLKERVASPDFEKLNRTLSHFQKEIADRFGIKDVYIGGGSARAILDHIYFGKPLEMRDLDIFIVADRPVDFDYAKSIGSALGGEELGRFSEENLRPRPRSNPALPIPQRYEYNAGYGFFFIDEQTKKKSAIFDLSIYHTPNDLKLNGILDFDTIMIKLDSKQDLSSWARSLEVNQQLIPANQLHQSKKIVDPNGGYDSWTARRVKIENWDQIVREPGQVTIRLARSLGKIGATEFTPEDAAKLRTLLQADKTNNHLQFVRNLLKLFEDPTAAVELKILASVGTFGRISPTLQARLQNLTADQIKEKIQKATNIYGKMKNGPPREVWPLLSLIDDLPDSEKSLFIVELSKPALFPTYFSEPSPLPIKKKGCDPKFIRENLKKLLLQPAI